MKRADPTVRSASLWLWTTVLVTLLPHTRDLPPWMSAIALLLLAWRGWGLYRPELAGTFRLLVIAIAIAMAVGVRLHYGHFFGKDPGVALLAALLCLKQLEIRTTRDVRAAVLLSFFLQLGVFFENQSLPVALLALSGTLLSIVTLLNLHTPEVGVRGLRTGTLLLAQSIPFLIVLFVLFPRIPGPLWGLPADAHSARTGLSDTMEPGSISNLGNSNVIAFRAEFEGSPPPPPLRYWRGPVLTEFDGRVWRARDTGGNTRPDYTPAGDAYRYVLTLEAHNRHWLLALEHPGAEIPEVRYSRDFRLLSPRPVRARSRFNLTAYPDTLVGVDESAYVLDATTRLPEAGNPQARALAREILTAEADPAARLARVLDFMRNADLIYTLQPPLLGANPVDEFLFSTHRGFCEHFSSAFVFLMRAADVPARVVTGYQGGEINPVDGTLVVRQSDAHAWAEVWLEGRGWVRVDPTALAAPARIESGLADALPEGEYRPFMLRPGMLWLRTARHQWEALSNAWHQHVIGFDTEDQHRLLERLGIHQPDWRALVGALVTTSLALMALLLGWAYRRQRRPDPLERVWDAFCGKMAHGGTPRHPWEGPIDFARRAARAHPDRRNTIREIAELYARLRYGSTDDTKQVETLRLRKRIKQFKLE